MAQQNSSKFMLKIAVISVALVIMIEGGVAPALPGMAKQFSDVNISLIQLVASIPGLLVIPASLLCGILGRFVNKKVLTLISLIVFLVTSISPVFLNNFMFILILRAFSGAACGFLYVLSASLITEYFTDIKEQNTLQGYKTGAANFGAIITSTVGGFLAVLDWHVIFWVFAIGFIPLILVIFCLPSKKPAYANTVEEKQHNDVIENQQPYILHAILGLIGFMLFIMLYFGFVANYSFIIEGDNLGNAAVSGFVYSVFTIGGVVGGILFSKLEKIFSKFTGVFFIAISAVCFWIFSSTHSLTLYFIFSFIFGIAFGVVNTLIYTSIAKRVPRSQTNLWFSLIVVFMGIGGFISSFVLPPIGKALGGASLYRTIFAFTAICFAIGMVIMLIYTFPSRTRLSNIEA